MTLTKKHWMIIGVVIALIAIWYFFLRKKKPSESGYNPYILVPEAGNWIDNSEPGGESGYNANMLVPGGYKKRGNTFGAPAERKVPSSGPTTANMGCAPGSLMVGPNDPPKARYECYPTSN